MLDFILCLIAAEELRMKGLVMSFHNLSVFRCFYVGNVEKWSVRFHDYDVSL